MSATPAIRTADTAVTSVDFRRMGSPLDRGPFVQEFRADPSDTRVVQSWAGRCQVRIPIGNRRLLLRRAVILVGDTGIEHVSACELLSPTAQSCS